MFLSHTKVNELCTTNQQDLCLHQQKMNEGKILSLGINVIHFMWNAFH